MLKVDPCRICGEPIQIPHEISFEVWKHEILQLASVAGVPVEAQLDQVKVGSGLSSMLANAEPCLAVYHAHHRSKYYHYIMTCKKMGNLTYVTQYLGGNSVNFRNSQIRDKSILSSILKGRGQAKYQEESIFYDVLRQIISESLEYALNQSQTPVPPPPRSTPSSAPQRLSPTPPPQRSASSSATTPKQNVPRVFFSCPQCHKRFRIQKRNVKIRFTCTHCGYPFDVDCSKDI